jgi:short-subunit dehydrogenase
MPQKFVERYGPWALVTGAARGIGRAFADQLAERGLSVIAVDLLEKDLRTSCDALRARGAAVEPFVADLAQDESVARLARLAEDRDIGLFVHCAAHIPSGRFLDADPAQHARAVAVNARTPLLLAHAVGSHMCRRGRGGIVLVSSMAALYGTGWVATYAATKAFEMILAESLWWEMKADGVDVLAALPGATDTEGLRMNSPYIEDPSALGKPHDVAREALDALGRAPSWICGAENRGLAEALRGLPREQAIDMLSNGTRLMCDGPQPGKRG